MSLTPTQIKDSIENLEKAMLSIMARVKAIEDLKIDDSLKAIDQQLKDIRKDVLANKGQLTVLSNKVDSGSGFMGTGSGSTSTGSTGTAFGF